MTSLWQAWGDVLVVCVLGLPVAVGVVWLLARCWPERPLRFAVAEVVGIGGTLPWLWMILTPDPIATRRVVLIPLRDLMALSGRDVIVQIGGNLLVFAALGALSPVRFPIRLLGVLGVAVAASTSVEISQYLLDLHRVSSIDDVLINTIGAGLAALCSRPWWRAIRTAVQPDGSDRRPPLEQAEHIHKLS